MFLDLACLGILLIGGAVLLYVLTHLSSRWLKMAVEIVIGAAVVVTLLFIMRFAWNSFDLKRLQDGIPDDLTADLNHVMKNFNNLSFDIGQTYLTTVLDFAQAMLSHPFSQGSAPEPPVDVPPTPQ